MAVRGENSSYFGENGRKLKVPNLNAIYESLKPKYEPIDFPSFNITTAEELSQKQIKKQQEILHFLREVNIKQTSTSRKQFWLTVATIALGVVTTYLAYLSYMDTQKSIKDAQQETLLLQNNLEQKEAIFQLHEEVNWLKKEMESLRAKEAAQKK